MQEIIIISEQTGVQVWDFMCFLLINKYFLYPCTHIAGALQFPIVL